MVLQIPKDTRWFFLAEHEHERPGSEVWRAVAIRDVPRTKGHEISRTGKYVLQGSKFFAVLTCSTASSSGKESGRRMVAISISLRKKETEIECLLPPAGSRLKSIDQGKAISVEPDQIGTARDGRKASSKHSNGSRGASGGAKHPADGIPFSAKLILGVDVHTFPIQATDVSGERCEYGEHQTQLGLTNTCRSRRRSTDTKNGAFL